MKFTVLSYGSYPPGSDSSQVVLIQDNWDDNFKFSTVHDVYYYDSSGTRTKLGAIKIGEFGMEPNQRSPALPQQFERLSDKFFSVGTDEDYYVALNSLGETVRNEILTALRDISYDLDLFEKARNEEVTQLSLMRFLSVNIIKGQFHRLTRGGARLTDYNFKFICPPQLDSISTPVELDFAVNPESTPPTNIHVLIGTNGVGKTYLLDIFSRKVFEETASNQTTGRIVTERDLPLPEMFSGLITVSFSAFDNIKPLTKDEIGASNIRYNYIGLKEQLSDGEFYPMPPARLANQFAKSLENIKQKRVIDRWKRAIKLLETDPKFRADDIASLLEANSFQSEKMAIELFSQLSSGHKIILLTITKLVETVEEKTLILMDEPEAHLHPPLLSAFVRALSDLLINRNGIAIIATHSPVVLQEVPKSCVWILNRYNSILKAERPERETFGENVGSLTRDVFGLEVTKAGFHKMLTDMIVQKDTYEDVIQAFNGEIGDEGKAIARALIIKKGQLE